jgi:hypothetical protein
VPPSGIRKFFDVLNSMPDVISLGVGEPDFDTPAAIVEAGIAALRAGRTHYTSNYGTIELRRALAAHLERRYGVAYDPEREIVITVGASEGLAASLAAVVDPGDEVVLAEPTYVAYAPDIIFAGGVPVFVAARPDDGWQLDPSREPSRREREHSSWGSRTTPRERSWSRSASVPSAPSPSGTTCSSSATRSTTGSCTVATATRRSVPCRACGSGRSSWAASPRPMP